jgi:hypothetical protein
VLLRLAYLAVTNTFVVLWLLPMGDRDKDIEILALRHQIAVLERQLGKEKVRFTPADRAFLAALLHRLPPEVVRRLRLLGRRTPASPGHRQCPPTASAALPITDQEQIARLHLRRQHRLGGILHEYEHVA